MKWTKIKIRHFRLQHSGVPNFHLLCILIFFLFMHLFIQNITLELRLKIFNRIWKYFILKVFIPSVLWWSRKMNSLVQKEQKAKLAFFQWGPHLVRGPGVTGLRGKQTYFVKELESLHLQQCFRLKCLYLHCYLLKHFYQCNCWNLPSSREFS
jgi:hypothetical protein